jgi:hypothetical protein
MKMTAAARRAKVHRFRESLLYHGLYGEVRARSRASYQSLE